MLRMRRVFYEIASEHITSSLQKLEQEEGQVAKDVTEKTLLGMRPEDS